MTFANMACVSGQAAGWLLVCRAVVAPHWNRTGASYIVPCVGLETVRALKYDKLYAGRVYCAMRGGVATQSPYCDVDHNLMWLG